MTGDGRAPSSGPPSSSASVSSSLSNSVRTESHSKMAASLLSSTNTHPSYVLNGVHPATTSLHGHPQLNHHVMAPVGERGLYPMENGVKKASVPTLSHKRKRQQVHGTQQSNATVHSTIEGGNSLNKEVAPRNPAMAAPGKPSVPPKFAATDTSASNTPRHDMSDAKRVATRPTTGRKYAIGSLASKTVRKTAAQITAIPVGGGEHMGEADMSNRTGDRTNTALQASAPAPAPASTPAPSPAPAVAPAPENTLTTASVPQKEGKKTAAAFTAPNRADALRNAQATPKNIVSASSAKLLSTVVSGMLGTICSYISQYGTPHQIQPCRRISERIVLIQENQRTTASATPTGGMAMAERASDERTNATSSQRHPASTDKGLPTPSASAATSASARLTNGKTVVECPTKTLSVAGANVSAATTDSSMLLDWIDIAREVYNIAGSFLWKHSLHHFRQSVGPRLKISEPLLLKSLAALDRAVRTHHKDTALELSTAAAVNGVKSVSESPSQSESAQSEQRTGERTSAELSTRKQSLSKPTQPPSFAERFIFPGSSMYFSEERQALPTPKKKRQRKNVSATSDEANVMGDDVVAARSTKPAVKQKKKANGAATKRKRRPVTQDGDEDEEEDDNEDDDTKNTTSSGRRRRQPKYLEEDRDTKVIPKSTSSVKARKADSQNRSTASRGRRRPAPGVAEDAGAENQTLDSGGKATSTSSVSPSRRGNSRGSERGSTSTPAEQGSDAAGNAQSGTMSSPSLTSVASTDPNAPEKIVLSATELKAATAAAAVAAKAAAKLKSGIGNGENSLTASPRTRRNFPQWEDGADNPI